MIIMIEVRDCGFKDEKPPKTRIYIERDEEAPRSIEFIERKIKDGLAHLPKNVTEVPIIKGRRSTDD